MLLGPLSRSAVRLLLSQSSDWLLLLRPSRCPLLLCAAGAAALCPALTTAQGRAPDGPPLFPRLCGGVPWVLRRASTALRPPALSLLQLLVVPRWALALPPLLLPPALPWSLLPVDATTRSCPRPSPPRCALHCLLAQPWPHGLLACAQRQKHAAVPRAVPRAVPLAVPLTMPASAIAPPVARY